MDWPIVATLGGLMLSAVFGVLFGVWGIERKFERKIDSVRSELKADIAENRKLIIEYIAKK